MPSSVFETSTTQVVERNLAYAAVLLNILYCYTLVLQELCPIDAIQCASLIWNRHVSRVSRQT